MGNRAVITFAPYADENVGVYVHWNGGRASVSGFLKACKELGYRSPGEDPQYAMARLIGAITAFFGGSTSVGVDVCRRLDTDNGDNGTYLIGPDWEIVGRMFDPEDEGYFSEDVRDHVARLIVNRIRMETPEDDE